MYVGRIVAVARTRSNRLAAIYRVSTRSYPNRQARQVGQTVAVVPKPGYESDIHKSPYIAYNCLRVVGDLAVVANGTQTDPIAERLASGMGIRDALGMVLLAMDYEHDHHATPRIAAVVDRNKGTAVLGTVRQDALIVQQIELQRGEVRYLATYEHNAPGPAYADAGFDAATAQEACQYVLSQGAFAALERPVLAAAALESGDEYEVACQAAEGGGM